MQEVGAFKAETETLVGHVECKVEKMSSLLLQHDRTQNEAADKNKLLVEKLESFAAEVQSTSKRTQTEVLGTQQAIPGTDRFDQARRLLNRTALRCRSRA